MGANDALLLERWRQRGDAEAFSEIVSRYSGMVYATCRRVLRNAEEAQDAAQECFIELMRARVEPSPTLGPWLHTVAVRRSLDRFKSARRRAQRELDHPQAKEAVHTEPETAELLSLIDEAIADLPDPLRALVIGRFLENRTHVELAEAQWVSEATVRYRLNNGIEQVRKFLKQRGVPVSAALLATVLGEQLVEAAPASLTASLGKLALGGVPPHIGKAGGGTPARAALNTLSAWKTGAVLAMLLLAAAAVVGLMFRQSQEPQDTPAIAKVKAEPKELRNTKNSPDPTQPETPSGDEGVPPPSAEPAVEKPATAASEIPPPAKVQKAKKSSEPCSISGTISDSTGQGISGARVTAAVWWSGYDFRTMRVWHGETNAGGQYAVTDIEVEKHGFVDVSVSAAGLETDGRRVEIEAGEDRGEVNFTVREGVALNARVLDASGNPVPSAAVVCRSMHSTSHSGGTNYHIASTDADGAFTMGFTGEGIASLLVVPPERPQCFFPAVPIGEPKTVDLTLTAPARLSGTVSYPDGSPAAGLNVMLSARYAPDGGTPDYAAHITSWNGFEITGACSQPTTTGADGSYVFADLPAVPDLLLSFSKQPEKNSMTCVELFKQDAGALAPGEDKIWNCTIPSDSESMTIRGRVLGQRSDKPLEAAVAYENTKTHDRSGIVLDPDNNGAYELKLTAPATYELWGRYNAGALDDGRTETGQTIPWAAGITRTVDFRLPDPFTMSVRVVDTEGQPVEGAEVDGHQQIFRKKHKTDENGHFEWDGFAPGFEAYFSITKDGYREAESQRITGEPGMVYPEETVVLHRVDEPEEEEPTAPDGSDAPAVAP
jgi:RNA polymerase sigma-70 factor (ECF subfamily)